MTQEEFNKHIKVLKLDPNSKYLLVVSRDSGIRAADLARLKLDKNFLDECILVYGPVDHVIKTMPISQK